ncbi:MAG: hypothetical protein H6707_09630 [Deltaproteobacteria bacterium]|nr:hypothetical protein [Deltaproteobacteria bacterium]
MQTDSQRCRRFALLLSVACFATLSFVAVSPASAGPWSKSGGAFYLKLNQSLFVADNFVDVSGTIVDGVKSFSATSALYGELGLGYGLQAALSLPFVHVCNDIGAGDHCRSSAGDLSLMLQYQLPRLLAPILIALRGELKIPLYAINNSDPFERPRAGDGQLDATLWLSAGGSFGRLPLYGFVEAGYRHRSEIYVGDTPTDRQFNDSLTLSAQAGYTLWSRLLLGLTLNGALPFRENQVTKGYLTLGPFAAYRLYRGLALEASFDPMIYAVASVRGFSGSLGLSYQREPR